MMSLQPLSHAAEAHFQEVDDYVQNCIGCSNIVLSYLEKKWLKPIYIGVKEMVFDLFIQPLYSNNLVVYLDLDGVVNPVVFHDLKFSKTALARLHELLFALGNVVVVLSSERRLDGSIFFHRDRWKPYLFSKVLIGKTAKELSKSLEDQLCIRYAPDIMNYPRMIKTMRDRLYNNNFNAANPNEEKVRNFFHRTTKILHHVIEKKPMRYFALDDLLLHHLDSKHIPVNPKTLLSRGDVLHALYLHASAEVYCSQLHDYFNSVPDDPSLKDFRNLDYC